MCFLAFWRAGRADKAGRAGALSGQAGRGGRLGGECERQDRWSSAGGAGAPPDSFWKLLPELARERTVYAIDIIGVLFFNAVGRGRDRIFE